MNCPVFGWVMDAPGSRAYLLQEIRKMRFEETYIEWQHKRLTQAEAAQILRVCEHTFRRRIGFYEPQYL